MLARFTLKHPNAGPLKTRIPGQENPRRMVLPMRFLFAAVTGLRLRFYFGGV